MTEDARAAFRTAADAHDAFERATGRPSPTDGGSEPATDSYRVTSTVFDARVSATGGADGTLTFAVAVEVPALDAAVEGQVGHAVVDGWFETLDRRLADATTATRVAVDGFDHAVEREGDVVTVTYEFECDDAAAGVAVAKTFVEYVEGTYVEGVVPGYDYRPPVSDLLSRAGQGDGDRGGTPL